MINGFRTHTEMDTYVCVILTIYANVLSCVRERGITRAGDGIKQQQKQQNNEAITKWSVEQQQQQQNEINNTEKKDTGRVAQNKQNY